MGLAVPGWAEGLPTYEAAEQRLWETRLVTGDKWVVGNCFRQGFNLYVDFWELVNTQLLIPQSGESVSYMVPGDVSYVLVYGPHLKTTG